MATPTIPNGEEYFFPIIYEGNGAGQRVGKFVPFTDSGTIANSCIFDRGSTGSLIRTPSSDGNKGVFTISLWYKPTYADNGILLYASGVDDAWSSGSSAGLYVESDTIRFYSSGIIFATNRTFEDTSKFYHILVANDSSQSGTDKIKLYVDGEQITSFATDNRSSIPTNSPFINTQIKHNVGGQTTTSTVNAFIDAYIAEYNFVDGTALTPSTFGVVDTSTGRWIPKALTGITYGTNGFRLKFQDSSALGDDTSGNGNDFTATNLASTDQTTDSPTQLFNTMGSFSSGVTKAEGNLKITTPSSGSGFEQCVGQPAFGVRSGKWYWEVKVNVKGQNGYGWKSDDNTGGSQANATGNYKQGPVYVVGGVGGFADGTWDVNFSTGASEFSAFTTASVDDVIMFALDLDNRKGYVGLNGTWFNSANPANGTGSIGLGRDPVPSANARFYPMCLRLNTTATGTYNFGATSFAHTPPTGFVALGQDNLPETAKGISGLVWTKNRDAADSHQLYDSSRGKQKVLTSNATTAEATVTDGLQKFLVGGQQIEDDVSINTSGESFVSWNWVANKGTTTTNDASATGIGTIDSTYQVNTTAGFSIVQRTGTGSAGTVAHGLGKAPAWIFSKNLNTTESWPCWHQSIGAAKAMFLNLTNAPASSTQYNSTAPTSTVFSVGATDGNNQSGSSHIDYVWCEVEGFSKFGKFVGNGNADGPFIYTGFTPAWIVFKANRVTNWYQSDGARSPFNPVTIGIDLNSSAVEYDGGVYVGGGVDYLSNGFKIRQGTGLGYNYTGEEIYYMCFAKHPFVGDGTNPVTAR